MNIENLLTSIITLSISFYSGVLISRKTLKSTNKHNVLQLTEWIRCLKTVATEYNEHELPVSKAFMLQRCLSPFSQEELNMETPEKYWNNCRYLIDKMKGT
ncbi:hypothetical protein BCR24_16145 [Enterococcus ureilyticus]|uniref:Uncharacterized protein n=2 Tax=Enterococcus ureilyticus TaxID=1131292 RepID=A0A1E5HBB5_9ENTE|nr:hypothetical protein BCR24_16145 [Enterococcus ureilyticus]